MKKISLLFRFFALVFVTLVTASIVQAQTYTDMLDFNESANGCCSIYSGNLVQGRDGNIYGTTYLGGSEFRGTIFQMTPAGAITTLHNFVSPEGNGPQGGLSMGLDGNFYGTTYQGGAHSAGTIFQITPGGTFTTLYSFSNTGDGAFPHTPPVPAPDGNLYGTTATGTASVVYKITPAGVFTKLATLPAESDGALVLGADGKFYGTTLHGGTFNGGIVFSVTTQGVLKTVFNFDNPTGSSPYAGLMLASDGNFYGTTSVGGTGGSGVVYKLTPAGGYTVLFNFSTSAPANGSEPEVGLVQGSDGFLYGVTSGGGANSFGALFTLKTNGSSFQVLYSFDKTHGAIPTSMPLLHTNGKIYGMTQSGGTLNEGVFYSFENNLKPFVSPIVVSSGKVGASVGLLGQGFNSATQVLFGTGPGTFTIVNDTYLTAKIALGATTGVITVKEPGGNLLSPHKFRIVPVISTFTPTSGPVGTVVTIQGKSLLQATTVKFGGVAATVFTVNSDAKVTATVPIGAVTGKITITTPGGTATSSQTFTVN